MPLLYRKLTLSLIATLVAAGTTLADNIIINGDFELPAVTDSHNWDIFTSIPGWQLCRGPSMELQRGVRGWDPAGGAQHLELDSDIDGPGGSLQGEDASSAIYQDLATEAGRFYELTFAFSPRPGVADNTLEILWDGSIIDTLTASGAGLSNTDWEYYTYDLSASSDLTRLEFGDRSVSDSLGTFIDDVSVRVVPEPASLLLLFSGAILRRRPA